MSNETVTLSEQKENKQSYTKQDLTWSLSMFGTAVGAGILFLPIRAGLEGFWPLILIAALVGPMTYFAHRALARFVLSSKRADADITDVVEEHFGKTAGLIITFLYFFAIYPIVLIYGAAITNTIDSFIVNQLGGPEIPRWLLSGALVAMMMGVMILGRRLMLIATELLVYPLVLILIGMSLYLVPHWSMEAMSLSQMPSIGALLMVVYLTIPMLVFSFNHSPAVSSMALAQREEYGENAVAHSDMILKRASFMLLGFVMLFVFSCVLALSPEQLAEAKTQNLPILSYLANEFDNPFISFLGPLVAFLAIFSSFFGHYLGAKEGLAGVIKKSAPTAVANMGEKNFNTALVAFFFLSVWGIAYLNPSVLGMIESLGAPFIAAILFLMPMYAIKKVPAMKKYDGALSNIFIIVMGVLAISSMMTGFF
ncbi:aromatic amino acid transport family protein [Pseudovibrio sp. SPO723]|uniref:aromatic amino acid transport family protein n=1 Tax=Nesiotobacter zosterae TaxID=392721 RepID=UPI0029C2F450|nr:aromatic amino acid transport family protein [Pseudovibrio sp. SPO723]MDX5594320.1 aromatic amino acid transport family protein [Pseudovibrio sp. SPO723]